MLLVVLGMLSLFTVLIVSFVVFSSQMSESSIASNIRRQNEILPDPPIDAAVNAILLGTDDPNSAAYGKSLFEDFYGVDGFELRVGHRRPNATANTTSIPRNPSDLSQNQAGSRLLLPIDAANVPRTTLFKIPTNMAWWHDNGSDGVVPNPTTAELVRAESLLTPSFDDAITSRIIAFEEGPLLNLPFRIVRYFGRDNGTPDEGVTVDVQGEYNLSSSIIVDLAEVGDELIEINGVPRRLYEVASAAPNLLTHGPGPDNGPGRINFDDNGNNIIDDEAELGWPNTDDIGYRFVLNGAVYNGRGSNPSGERGLVIDADPTAAETFLVNDPHAQMELTVNSRLIGANYRGGSSTASALAPEYDEPWDAADLENWFLAWQPSDHRRSNVAIYPNTTFNSAELNRQLGQHIIPSFHRPEVINYLMNTPIRLPGEDGQTVQRTFNDIRFGFDNTFNDGARLALLVQRLRRATLRPLNFEHNGDLDGDGSPYDGNPQFSGSNATPILNQTIDPTDVADVLRLATWLVNGPWDVDNDGDGLPDSVWVDLNLPAIAAPDGQFIKPMIAALIEDMDGKININFAGSYNQLISNRFAEAANTYANDGEYFNAHLALSTFSRGGGLGPAEIDFSHLFANERPVPLGFLGPLSTNQTGPPLPLDAILRTRYGNLLNARYGGEVYNYTRPYPYSLVTSFEANALKFPGIGTRAEPRPDGELLSRIPLPGRTANFHSAASTKGRPVDMAGVMQTRRDEIAGATGIQSRQERGNTQRFDSVAGVGVAGVLDEVVNQPYEFGATEIRGDDAPFSASEQIDFIRGGPLQSRLSQLLGDAADRNEALRRLLTVESRSVDSPETPGLSGMVQLLLGKLPPAGNAQQRRARSIQLQRMLGLELRKGSKLNLNRSLGNGNDENGVFVDETAETTTLLADTPNQANNRRAAEANPFPQLGGAYLSATSVAPSYGPTSVGPVVPTIADASDRVPDFDGIDTDNDGLLDSGTFFDTNGDSTPDSRARIADGDELLARHLYCLMFMLIVDSPTGELVPNFPYPPDFDPSIAIRNAYVAKRLAQWAVNAVDYRDHNAKRTRLRYDPNPFDANGFDLDIATRHTVWGMERPELEISEAIAFHDKATRRNLTPEIGTEVGQVPSDIDPDSDSDGDPTTGTQPDADMDQHRIPQATAILEFHSLRSALVSPGTNQPNLPPELYTANQLDLGRVVGVGDRQSPVWRVAVGAPTANSPDRSTRWLFDAARLSELIQTDPTRVDELAYLNGTGVDFTDTTQTDPGNPASYFSADWVPSKQHSVEVSHVARPVVAGTEVVRLADDDFDPTNGSAHNILLERFAWFTRRLQPDDGDPVTPATLHVVDPTRGSGMRPGNVYWSRPNVDIWTGPATRTSEALPLDVLLPLGHYAVLAPRGSTRFGLIQGGLAPYNPSNQRFEFELTGGSFKFNYFDSLATAALNPLSADSVSGERHINYVVPIICQGYYPHEVEALRTDWNAYLNNASINAGEHVDVGFNVSAPLPGMGYYPAPEFRIDGSYPFYDTYFDSVNGVGGFPDVPFDQDPIDPNLAVRPPVSMNASAPLQQNSYADPAGSGVTIHWDFVGTHQEVRTIFLQRLADPTQPWHAIDNPYLTEDFIPIDLTTFTGDGDASEEVSPADIRTVGGPYHADSGRVEYQVGGPSMWREGSLFDPVANNYNPIVKMDSRRKVPEWDEDRPTSVLVPGGNNPGTTLANYNRIPAVVRSPLTASVNVIRESARSVGGNAYWPFEVGSNWTAPATLTEVSDPVDTSYGATTSPDSEVAAFTQTFGFVNREYGFPVRSDDPQRVYFGIGNPARVVMNMPTWMDREFQSPINLVNVPADSRTRLLKSYGPGTVLEPGTFKEFRVPFEHLLGFEDEFAEVNDAELRVPVIGPTRSRLPLGMVDESYVDNLNTNGGMILGVASGGRAGFEQIFDFVDTGPLWFDSQHWFDPSQVRFFTNTAISSLPAGEQLGFQMYNRVVETLQPPYNYIGRHRTPGKINLNTTPDYIRRANAFDRSIAGNELLDGFELGTAAQIYMENSERPDNLPLSASFIASNPGNTGANGNGFSIQFLNPLGFGTVPTPYPSHLRLFGNGSVFRSLSWGMSNAFELDEQVGIPETNGQNFVYSDVNDTSFGRGFKAFIESRRGHHSTNPGVAGPATNLGNPAIDARYPTRFAGLFAPARAAGVPAVQRFMRQENEADNVAASGPANGGLSIGFPRRTHDMGILRPHPDFDERTLNPMQRANAADVANAGYSLGVEANATENPANDSSQASTNNVVLDDSAVTAISGLRSSLVNTTLFDRTGADLHNNFRNLDHDPHFRFADTARLANQTTHHSNVFLIRLTLGYFIVDPLTGAVGQEYTDETGEANRSKATYMVDRTIPIGFLRGRNLGVERTILYSEVTE
ncbi:MAG: hypothetical protein AAF802_06240 [Planctomycetota bacterium]